MLGKNVIFPDFTLLNLRTRKTFYHEHFGMMDDPVYCQSAIWKINSYMSNGIFPGKGLLLTFESSDCPLDMRILDGLIDNYLI